MGPAMMMNAIPSHRHVKLCRIQFELEKIGSHPKKEGNANQGVLLEGDFLGLMKGLSG